MTEFSAFNTNFRSAARFLQLTLFDAADYSTVVAVSPLADWSLNDLRLLAIDPEVHVRQWVALNGHSVDEDLQRVLAVDPDESVVLALLSRVDPSVEINHLIINGPHVRARRELAGRNLSTATLRVLGADTDAITRIRAQVRLAARGVSVSTVG